MEQVAGALKHVLIIGALILVLHWTGEKIGLAIARFRQRRHDRRQERNHAEKLKSCRATVRGYEPGDAASVSALIREYAGSIGVDPRDDWIGGLLNDPVFLSNILVAEIGKKIVGYALWQNEIYGAFRTVAILTDIYVRPDFRREGVGSSLVMQVARDTRAAGYDVFNCVAEPQDEGAAAFLDAIGAFRSPSAHCLVLTPPADAPAAEAEPTADIPVSDELPPSSATLH